MPPRTATCQATDGLSTTCADEVPILRKSTEMHSSAPNQKLLKIRLFAHPPLRRSYAPETILENFLVKKKSQKKKDAARFGISSFHGIAYPLSPCQGVRYCGGMQLCKGVHYCGGTANMGVRNYDPAFSVFGSCVLEANTWIVVKGARGIVGPIVASYSLAQTAAVLTLQQNSSIQLTEVSATRLVTEGSIIGKGSPSDAAGTFTINIVEPTMLMGVTGISLSTSTLCGFEFLVGPQSAVTAASATQPAVSLQCNLWSPIPLQQLLVASSVRLLPSQVHMSSPGKSDWSPSCPFDLDASSTTTPTLVVVPHAYPLLFVRSATSVVVGSSVVAGSLLGGSYGAVHGIQAAMLILRAQALCAEGSSDPATPEELCCDLGTSAATAP